MNRQNFKKKLWRRRRRHNDINMIQHKHGQRPLSTEVITEALQWDLQAESTAFPCHDSVWCIHTTLNGDPRDDVLRRVQLISFEAPSKCPIVFEGPKLYRRSLPRILQRVIINFICSLKCLGLTFVTCEYGSGGRRASDIVHEKLWLEEDHSLFSPFRVNVFNPTMNPLLWSMTSALAEQNGRR